MCAYIL